MNESMYTQGVGLVEPPIGSYYQGQPEMLAYPDQPGSSYLPSFGSITSREPMWGYGSDPTLPPPETAPPQGPPGESPPTFEVPPTVKWYAGAWWVLSTASMAASAYHGYKRNDSVGWAVAWGLLGGMFPVLVPAIALAQGFGKRK